MYNTAFQKLGMDYVYLAFQIDQTSLADAIRSMRTLQMRGANVSMPNKTAVIQYLTTFPQKPDRVMQSIRLSMKMAV